MSMEELFNAISEINLLKVQEILYSNQNLNINQVNKLGQNIFHIAAKASDGCNGCNLAIFKILISYAKEHGYDRELIQLINDINQFGDTVIMNVVKNNYNTQEILELLVANGANIHQRNPQNQTVLYYAITVEATKSLLDLGANLFVVDRNGNTVFHRAAEYNNIKILEFLIQTAKNNGYDQELIQSLNAKNTFGRSVIYNAANEYYNPDKKLELLIQNGADVDYLNHNNETALHKFLNSTIVNTNILHGNIVFDQNFDKNNVIESVENLLSVGANPNIPDKTDNYPIHLATKKENFKELCKLLILAGANVNNTDANGNTLEDLIINRVNQNDAEALLTAKSDAAELYDFAESITVLTNDFSINNSSEALYNFPLPFPNRYLIYKKIFGSNFPSKNSLHKFLTQNIFTKKYGKAAYNDNQTPKCDDAKILNIPYNILKEELDIFTLKNRTTFLTNLHNNMWKTIALTTSYNTEAKNDVFGNKDILNLILNYVGGDVKPYKGLAELKTYLKTKIDLVQKAYKLWTDHGDNVGIFDTKESEITTLTTVHPYEKTKECDIPSIGETTNLQEYPI